MVSRIPSVEEEGFPGADGAGTGTGTPALFAPGRRSLTGATAGFEAWLLSRGSGASTGRSSLAGDTVEACPGLGQRSEEREPYVACADGSSGKPDEGVERRRIGPEGLFRSTESISRGAAVAFVMPEFGSEDRFGHASAPISRPTRFLVLSAPSRILSEPLWRVRGSPANRT
jgi:hypothetical protein